MFMMFGTRMQHSEKELSSRSFNYSATILDEIALEGLDGITLQGLWVRLGACPYFPITIDPDSQKFIWEIIKKLQDVNVYELPTERAPLVLFNRFDLVDQELGDVIEPDIVPEDIYPYKVVDDQEKGVFGSCMFYEDRRLITKKARLVSLEEATREWGSRLVLVASQCVRSAALMGEDVDPCLELPAKHYCLLERIGRARYHGEVTQGKISLHCTGEEPKKLFYYRKTLLHHKLITKQNFNLKSNAQNCSGSLFHLPRFFTEHKTKTYSLTEKVVDFLKTKSNFTALYDEVRSLIGGTNTPKKLFKTPDFQRFVKTEQVPFRTIYPDASVQQWKQKASDKEKVIRVARLLNPCVSVRDEWVKEEGNEEEEEEGIGYIDESSRTLDVPLMTQAFNAVDESGPNGLTQVELSRKLGMTNLHARTLCRNLMRRNLVSDFMSDAGRQHFFRYCSKRFGHLSQEFNKERDKMLSLLGSKRKAEENVSGLPEKKRRTEQENGLPFAENLSQSDQQMPLVVKLEVPDLPITVGIPDGSVADCDSTPSGPSEYTDQILDMSVSSKVPHAQSTPKVSRKRKNVSTNICLEDPDDDAEKESPIEITIVEDVPFLETKKKDRNSNVSEDGKNNKNANKDPPAVTTRVLKRMNLIIEAVQQQTVIDDQTKLLKMIQEEEEKEGLRSKIDRKSLQRLLDKLSKDGHIKSFKAHISGGLKEKTLNFICLPNITSDHSIIQSALDQAKVKVFVTTNERLYQMIPETKEKVGKGSNENIYTKFNSSSIDQSISELSSLESSVPSNGIMSSPMKGKSKIGKQYGYQPKFVRMKTLHKLLFYLIYDYEGVPSLDQDSVKDMLKEKTTISHEIEREMPQVYFPAIDWRMFIPPLRQHAGWPKGWALLCDILLNLPLSIFLHIININFTVAGLDEYLSHPVRKHYPLKTLPASIQSQLRGRRRFIYSCHEVLTLLCYIGIVQFGPHTLKDKEKAFLFLNKNASLMDTTTSPAGYHQVSQDMEYKVLPFHFSTSQDVEQYWYQLWSICVNTPLGGRNCVSGKEITIENLGSKPAMQEAVHPRNPEDAPSLDNGEVPGDHSGAAGLDSALFSHLKKNWNWFNNVSATDIYSNPSPVVNDHLPQVRRTQKEPLKRGTPKSVNQLAGETLSPRSFASKMPGTPNKATTPVISKKRHFTKTTKVRRVPMPRASRKKPRYDNADKKALSNMIKRRVGWTAPENNLLLLYKVATSYLSPKSRKHTISMQTWRDLLHRSISTSHDKSSQAIARRIIYMMKNPSTEISVSMCLEEIKQDPKINRQFGNIYEKLKARNETPEVIERTMNQKFNDLVEILRGRFQNMWSHSATSEEMLIPDSIEEFRCKFSISNPVPSMREKRRFEDVSEVSDIHASVINSMIYSSLCCINDKTSFAYQLYKVYQQYPDALLCSTIAKIRADEMVSLRKSYARTKLKSGQFLPVSNCPYQLSIRYQYLLQTKFQYDIYQECFLTLQKLAWDMLLNTDVDGLEFLMVDGGSAATFIEYLIMDKISFQISIPDQLILLDPRISDKDETYNRIVNRYREILRKCNVGRDLASTVDVSASQKPFLEILNRDDIWDKEDEAPSCKRKKIAEESKSSCTPNTSNSQHEKPQSLPNVEGDISESGEDDDECGKELQNTAQNAVARAATRIALYMMRGESEQTNVRKIKETQHAHDFFVVNSCKVVCRLKEDISKDAPTEVLVGIDPKGTRVKCAVSRSLLPVDAALASEVLESIKKNAVFEGPSASEGEIFSALKGRGISGALLQKIVLFVESKDNFGATFEQLREEFKEYLQKLSETLKVLVETQILLRAGVTKVVFVHYKSVRPWLVYSRKLFRLDREKLNPTDGKAVSVAQEKEEVEEVEDLNMEIEGFGEEVAEEVCLFEEEDESDEGGDQSEEQPEGPTNITASDTEVNNSESTESKKVLHLRNARTKRGVARLKEGAPETLDEIDSVPSDQIRVCMRPWIRVDGSINRRVLDRLLGSVLGYCMSNPGCSVLKVGERFSPALQPFHSRELCEILQKLGCIQWNAVKRSHVVSLFSKPRTITIENADGTERENDIYLEACADAVLRLSLFIGDKAYKKDFLTTF